MTYAGLAVACITIIETCLSSLFAWMLREPHQGAGQLSVVPKSAGASPRAVRWRLEVRNIPQLGSGQNRNKSSRQKILRAATVEPWPYRAHQVIFPLALAPSTMMIMPRPFSGCSYCKRISNAFWRSQKVAAQLRLKRLGWPERFG